MTDILLDDRDGTYVTVDSRVLKSKAMDLQIDSPQRHRADRPGLRRAIVHDQRDGLTINYNRDYPGGVTINDVVALTNRFGLLLTGVKEISGLSQERVAGTPEGEASSAHRTRTLTLRGHIMFDPNPDQESSEPISLQNLVTQLQTHVDVLTKKITEMERSAIPQSRS